MTMHTMHPAVLLGSYGWEQNRLPADEYELRIKAAQALMDEHGWSALFVYGDAVEHHALAFLTNFVPRMRWAIAMLPRDGEPRILLSVSSRDIPAMSQMTWIDDVHTGWTWDASFNPWFDEFYAREGGTPKVGLLGKDLMRTVFVEAFDESIAGRVTFDRADEIFAPLLSAKRPREVSIIRDAYRILDDAAGVLADSWREGADGMHAAIAGERAARRMAAHDVRILFSVDGGRTLLPFYGVTEGRGDPMVAYLAVKYLGYWAERFVTVGDGAPVAKRNAEQALEAMVAAAKAGIAAGDIAQVATDHLGGKAAHPVIGKSFGHAIGLSLGEAPDFTMGNSTPLQVGNCYTLRFGIDDPQEGCALTSAMVQISQDGARFIGE